MDGKTLNEETLAKLQEQIANADPSLYQMVPMVSYVDEKLLVRAMDLVKETVALSAAMQATQDLLVQKQAEIISALAARLSADRAEAGATFSGSGDDDGWNGQLNPADEDAWPALHRQLHSLPESDAPFFDEFPEVLQKRILDRILGMIQATKSAREAFPDVRLHLSMLNERYGMELCAYLAADEDMDCFAIVDRPSRFIRLMFTHYDEVLDDPEWAAVFRLAIPENGGFLAQESEGDQE